MLWNKGVEFACSPLPPGMEAFICFTVEKCWSLRAFCFLRCAPLGSWTFWLPPVWTAEMSLYALQMWGVTAGAVALKGKERCCWNTEGPPASWADTSLQSTGKYSLFSSCFNLLCDLAPDRSAARATSSLPLETCEYFMGLTNLLRENYSRELCGIDRPACARCYLQFSSAGRHGDSSRDIEWRTGKGIEGEKEEKQKDVGQTGKWMKITCLIANSINEINMKEFG